MTKRMRLLPLMTILLAVLCCACGGKDNGRDVPRPEAWPRISTYPASYHPLKGTPVSFPINDSTVAFTEDNADWVTVYYPRYRVNLHLTFTHTTPATVDKVIDNRVQRMALNSGSNESQLTELTNPAGYTARLMKTPRGSLTPLQILAVGNDMVVSGAVVLNKPKDLKRPDSLAPVLDALEADLLYALKNMK